MRNGIWLILGLLVAVGCGRQDAGKMRIGVMPKLVGIDYFNACEKGAIEAGNELGVEVTYDGPITNDVTKQAEMLDAWITQRFDAICVAPNDPHALAPTLKRAMKRGIKVLTWDSDSDADSRDFFVNQATYEDIGYGLVDIMAEQTGGKGEVAIITGALTAANQNIWMEWMRKCQQTEYPELEIVSVRPSEEDQQLAFQVALDLLKAFPNLKGIWGITSVSFPGAAGAVREAGRSGEVKVVGLATPNSMRQYVEDGTVETVLLWNPVDLGYLTVQAAKRLVDTGKLPEKLEAGRLGEVWVFGKEVMLGAPMRFTKENIGEFDF